MIRFISYHFHHFFIFLEINFDPGLNYHLFFHLKFDERSNHFSEYFQFFHIYHFDPILSQYVYIQSNLIKSFDHSKLNIMILQPKPQN